MKSEELKHRITFQKLEILANDNGFEFENWTNFNTVWAAAANLHGREYYAAASVQAENTVKFTIRYLPGLTADMKILFEGKKYNITSIDNVKYANKFIEINAMEVESGG